MFKPGDKVICINNGIIPGLSQATFEDMLTIGKKYIVLKAFETTIRLEDLTSHSFYNERFKLVKEITNEYEWLDAVRENFKNGV